MVLVLTSMSVTVDRERSVRHGRNRLVAELAAQSGVARQVSDIKEARDLGSAGSFTGIDALDTNSATGPGGYSLALANQTLQDFSGTTLAEYDVLVDIVTSSGTSRQISITCYAYVPSKADYESGVQDAVRADAHTVAELAFEGSEVFDYSYFINHWGWFYGNTIVTNGNVRSNGQFDFGGYGATVNGTPRYAGSDGTDLVGYKDDNGDGVMDGSDGGAYSGTGVVNAQNVQGMGGQAENQHTETQRVEMPNLTDLTLYEQQAAATGATVSVGGTVQVDGVLGDDTGELENLYLVGTQTDPIMLNGPIVVRGNVVVSGYVTGQGSIYAGGNIYVPNDLVYLDPPTTPTPTATDQSTVESWRADALGKDSLGLFATEHVVIGDYTHDWWQHYVAGWINNSLNESKEDAGIDGIQNTAYGLDGIAGTADDDVLEGDGVWTVSYYTDEDAAAGRIPAGKSVGDVIPGSGEDIDGDGVFDDRTQMSEFNLPVALDPANWAGNLTTSHSSYSEVSTIEIGHLDAAFYTNHSFAALMIKWGTDIVMNGSVVSRNESIIYGADHIIMNHDERLTGRGSSTSGFESAVGWNPIEYVQWEFEKPLPEGVGEDPDAIVEYYSGTNPS